LGKGKGKGRYKHGSGKAYSFLVHEPWHAASVRYLFLRQKEVVMIVVVAVVAVIVVVSVVLLSMFSLPPVMLGRCFCSHFRIVSFTTIVSFQVVQNHISVLFFLVVFFLRGDGWLDRIWVVLWGYAIA